METNGEEGRGKGQTFQFRFIKFELLISSFSEDFQKVVDTGNCFKEFCCKEAKEWVVIGKDGEVSRKLFHYLFSYRKYNSIRVY